MIGGKKYQKYYVQRKLILKIFESSDCIKKAIEAGITPANFEDPDLRLIYIWMLQRHEEGKKINVVRAQHELRQDLGSLQRFIPFLIGR